MKKIAAFGAIALAGCGGAPPPAAPVGPATLAEMAPATPAILGDARPAKVLEVLSAAERVPDDDKVQAQLALASFTGEVRLVDGGLDVEAPSVRCTVRKGPKPGDVPDARFAPDVERHGLASDDLQRLGAATGAAVIECRTEGDEMPAFTAVPVAESVADAVAKVVDGAIHDPQTGRYWPQAAWKAAREGRRDFDVARSVAVERGRGGERTWLATRGLVAFGRPDLAFFPVRADDADGAAAKLLVIADSVIRGEPLGDGSRLDVGPTTTLLWAADAYGATLPAGAPRPEAAQPTAGRVAIVDPGAKPGDVAAAEAFVGRLLRQ